MFGKVSIFAKTISTSVIDLASLTRASGVREYDKFDGFNALPHVYLLLESSGISVVVDTFTCIYKFLMALLITD